MPDFSTRFITCGVMSAALLCLAPLAIVPAADRPNIIYILADDLGYGDLGCYGQRIIRTPNLDRLATEGLRFTRHYSGSSVCAPSRCSLMTGLTTGHTPVRGNHEVMPEGQDPLPATTVTIPKVLQAAGYRTAAFGKWGLGYPGSEGSPLRQGFDVFFGYNCQRLAHNYYPHFLRSGDEKHPLVGNEGAGRAQYAPDVIQARTLDYLDSRARQTEPFFLYVPFVFPHAELAVPDDSILASYRGKFAEIPFKGVDQGPEFKAGGYGSVAEPRATYAAMITRLDLHVGRILQRLQDLGLEQNTVVMFSSDNGPHAEGGANPTYFNSKGDLRGQKRDLYEGGVCVPFIVRWPGHVAPGGETAQVCAFWDIMPTVSEIAGAKAPDGIDGISILPTLLGKPAEQIQHNNLYWEFHELGGRQAIRSGHWKAVRLEVAKDPNGPLELYDLDHDSNEQHNVAAQHPDVVRELAKQMREARTESVHYHFEQ